MSWVGMTKNEMKMKMKGKERKGKEMKGNERKGNENEMK